MNVAARSHRTPIPMKSISFFFAAEVKKEHSEALFHDQQHIERMMELGGRKVEGEWSLPHFFRFMRS